MKNPKPKAKSGERFCTINPSLSNHGRCWFTTEEKAANHATDIFTRKRRFNNYEPPPKLLIVKVVGVVEITTRRRKPRPDDTVLEPDA